MIRKGANLSLKNTHRQTAFDLAEKDEIKTYLRLGSSKYKGPRIL